MWLHILSHISGIHIRTYTFSRTFDFSSSKHFETSLFLRRNSIGLYVIRQRSEKGKTTHTFTRTSNFVDGTNANKADDRDNEPITQRTGNRDEQNQRTCMCVRIESPPLRAREKKRDRTGPNDSECAESRH